MCRYSTPLIMLVALLSGCASRTSGPTYEQVPDALTPGIFWEETRALIPEGFELREVYSTGVELTKVSEGFRSQLYNDAAGFCTIGYGHLVKKSGCDGTEKPEFRNGISEPRGEEILVVDMNWAKYAVMDYVSAELTQGQYAALVDFVFNVGSGNFKQSTLLRKVNGEQHDQVPFQLRRWVKAGGKVWPGLVTRREREIDLYLEDTAIPRLLPPPEEELPAIDIRLGEVGS